ncbi:MAG TPA: hypothetical protein VGK67_35935 [Myxococcales bacterium]
MKTESKWPMQRVGRVRKPLAIDFGEQLFNCAKLGAISARVERDGDAGFRRLDIPHGL